MKRQCSNINTKLTRKPPQSQHEQNQAEVETQFTAEENLYLEIQNTETEVVDDITHLETEVIDDIQHLDKQTAEPDMEDIINDIIENVVKIGLKVVNPLKVPKIYHPKPKIFECNKCNKMFAQHRSAQKHQKECKGAVKPKPIVCQEINCKKSFYDKQTLRRHFKSFHSSAPKPREIFRCEQCNIQFGMKHKLKEHNMNKHGLEQPALNCVVKCPFVDCDFEHEKERFVKSHITNRHETKSPEKCSICDYKCFSEGGMKRHTRDVHTVSSIDEMVGMELQSHSISAEIENMELIFLSDGTLMENNVEFNIDFENM